MKLHAKHLAAGLDDGVSRSIELVVTPMLFGLAGYGLDRWLGLTPLLTIALALFGIAGVGARVWYEYDASMKAHERELAARRSGAVRPEELR